MLHRTFTISSLATLIMTYMEISTTNLISCMTQITMKMTQPMIIQFMVTSMIILLINDGDEDVFDDNIDDGVDNEIEE